MEAKDAIKLTKGYKLKRLAKFLDNLYNLIHDEANDGGHRLEHEYIIDEWKYYGDNHRSINPNEKYLYQRNDYDDYDHMIKELRDVLEAKGYYIIEMHGCRGASKPNKFYIYWEEDHYSTTLKEIHFAPKDCFTYKTPIHKLMNCPICNRQMDHFPSLKLYECYYCDYKYRDLKFKQPTK